MLVLAGAVLAAALAALAAAAALLATAPGHAIARRLALRLVEQRVHGQVRIGTIGGSLWRSVDFADVTIATPDGRPVLRAERLSARYALADLVRSRFRFQHVAIVRPVVNLEQAPDGRWNVERLFGGGTAGPGGRRPLVELLDVRIEDGSVRLRQRAASGANAEREVSGLTVRFTRLRLSHPDSTALVADVAELAARVRHPDLRLLRAQGEAELDGDSLRFAFGRLVLPATAASASGAVRWDGPQTALRLEADARRLRFDDVRALVPLPLPREGGGAVRLTVRLGADGSSAFAVHRAELTTGRSRLSLAGALTIGPRGGVSLRRVDATLQPLDLAVLRLYADTVPVRGLVRGRVRADGALGRLATNASLSWSDESVAGAPVTRIAGHGVLALGGEPGIVFRGFTLGAMDFSLATIHRFAPPVDLPGRLRGSGVLDGPWRDATFRGVLAHAGEGPDSALVSRAGGSLRLALGDTVALSADLDFDLLSLDLLRRRWPAIPLTGVLRGRVRAHGPVTALVVDADLRGAAGRLAARGTVGARDSLVAVALTGSFDSLDLGAAAARLPRSALAGRWGVDLLVPQDHPAAATGLAHVSLEAGVVSGVAVSGGAVWARLARVRVGLDSARLSFEGGRVSASGAIGRGGGLPGRMDLEARVDTAAYLEPLVRWLRQTAGDSSPVRLDGAASLTARLEGTADAWRLQAALAARGVQLGQLVGRGLTAGGRLDHGPQGDVVNASAAADTLEAAGLRYVAAGLGVSGPLDSLAVRLSAGFHVASALEAGFTVVRGNGASVVRADRVTLDLPARRWILRRPARLVLADGALRVDSLELRADSGAGRLAAVGSLPGESGFSLVLDSVPVVDVYALLQRDTARVSGAMDGTLRIAGPAEDPRIGLRLTLSNGHFGDYRLPLLRLAADYAGERLRLEGGLWRDSLRLLTMTGSVPVDLALRPAGRRLRAGPLDIAARADSLDMAVLTPLTDLVTDLGGRLTLDAHIGGTWDAPSLAGEADVTGGTVRVPALGAAYTGVDARLVLENDVMRIARARLDGGGGRLDVAGRVSFPSLTRPVLDLTLTASRFAAFDIPGFGALTASGDLTLRGPAVGATLTGRIAVDAGSLQLRDVVEKQIVSLDDPELRALVDTNLARAAELGPPAHVVMLDSLRIRGLSVALGSDVWLRSSEANVQLAGDFDVERGFEAGQSRYRMDGTLRAVRGTYRLTLGKQNSFLAISRDFRVTRGTVRFFGTPDFNPSLDIAAEHVVRTAQGGQLTVRALIGGTLRAPELRLESDAQPPLSETEIVSYLMFGQPPSSLTQSGAGGRREAALAQAVGASLVGGVGQALASELGLALDYLTIVPGAARPGATGVGTARLEAGAQLGERTFLTVNAGLCEVLAAQLVGATLEYRLSRRFTASAAFEPVIQECGASAGLTGLSTRKQIGFDLFWQQGIR